MSALYQQCSATDNLGVWLMLKSGLLIFSWGFKREKDCLQNCWIALLLVLYIITLIHKKYFEDWVIWVWWNIDCIRCILYVASSKETYKAWILRHWALMTLINIRLRNQNQYSKALLQVLLALPYYQSKSYWFWRLLMFLDSFMSIWGLLYHPSKLHPYQHSQASLSYNFHINLP